MADEREENSPSAQMFKIGKEEREWKKRMNK
jgi:hypothetical protein